MRIKEVVLFELDPALPPELAFTSCRRFDGRFYLRPGALQVVIDAEELAIAPGEGWDLEEIAFHSGPDREILLGALAGRLDAFLLGCNHPIWASLGLIHGSRSSNDIKRAWARVAGTARQNLRRNWQNGRLWWNDPDAVVLMGDLSFRLPGPHRLRDVWSDADLGVHPAGVVSRVLPARSGRLLAGTPAP